MNDFGGRLFTASRIYNLESALRVVTPDANVINCCGEFPSTARSDRLQITNPPGAEVSRNASRYVANALS